MARRRARRLISTALAATLASLAAGFADDPGALGRLEAMPRERRLALAENLARFDKLDPIEKAAVRKLDAAIARRDPVEQARYRAVLRRYHLWFSGLTEAQKEKIQAIADPAERFEVARKLRLAEGGDIARATPRVSGIRAGDYGLIGPFEVAYLLKVWRTLTPARQAEIARRDGGRLREEIRQEAEGAGVVFVPFLRSDEATYDARLEADANFKSMVGPLIKKYQDDLKAHLDQLRAESDRLQAEATALAARKDDDSRKKADPAQKKADEAQKKVAEARRIWQAAQRRAEHKFAEFLYFEDNPPKSISPRNMERFVATCPAWLMAMVDPLAPDDARVYLTILYRQLYPHPREMPEGSKTLAEPAPIPSKKAAAKKAKGAADPILDPF